jgi:hypothetical protein
MADCLAIQSSFHSRATLLHNATKNSESFTQEEVDQFNHQMTRLKQYWLDHPVEIDALHAKLILKRSPYASIVPFYDLIRNYNVSSVPFYELMRNYSAAFSSAKSATAF